MQSTVTSEHSGPSFRNIARRKLAAFTLVEVTLSIGIMAFAFLSVFGLLPTGTTIFRQAMDTSVGSQIAQRVFNESQQTDFDQLIVDKNGHAIAPNATGLKATRYFDEQGTEVTDSSKAIYHVNTRVMPMTMTKLPNDTDISNLATLAVMASVTIQIVNNPGNQLINPNQSTNLWEASALPIATYSGLVARNK